MGALNLALPLEGCCIIEFGLNLPGPMLSQRLSQYGARVIKIEPPSGDPTAEMFKDANGVSILYGILNDSKHIETIDLKSEQGRVQALAYISHADILIESSTVGVMDALGLSEAVCRAQNPALIYCSLSGYGESPIPGHDINFIASAGLGAALGYGVNELLPDLPIGDIVGGVLAAESAILAALISQRSGGGGKKILINIVEELKRIDVMGFANRHSQQNGIGHFLIGKFPCYRVYVCREGSLLAVGALEQKFWLRFCKLIAQEQLNSRQFETADVGDSQVIVEQALLKKTASQWEALSMEAPCCLTAIVQ